MKTDKKYPQLLMNDEFFKYFIVFVVSLFILILFIFNDEPTTPFEIFINDFLIKGRGVYSHIYPFQSEIISNLSMILVPFISIYLYLTVKIIYLSEEEIILLGGKFEKSLVRVIFINIVGISSLLIILSVFIFCAYFDFWDLEEVDINTLFISDNIFCLLFLSVAFCLGSISSLSLLIIILLKPVKLLGYHIYLPNANSRKEKMRLLMKKQRENRHQK